MPPSRVVDEGLRAVDPPTEEGSRAHPRMCKLHAVLRANNHAERRIGAFDFNAVRAGRELKRVVCRLFFVLIFFRIVSKLESADTSRFHDVFSNIVLVGHGRNFLDHTPQEQIPDIRVVFLAAWAFHQRSVVDAPLEELLLVEFGQAEGGIVDQVMPRLPCCMLHAVFDSDHLQISVLLHIVSVLKFTFEDATLTE